MIDNTADLDAVRVYEHHRPRLWGIAYRMLGSVHDAEDVLQESYLRWHQADTAAVHTPEAWLVRVTTRLAIDRLRRTTAEREHYVGDWLPEPVATDTHAVTERRAEQASDLSMAFLVILERLAPEERAAMLLRDVFDTDYTEIARVLEKSEAACRQLVHRARVRVRRDRARFLVPPEVKERLVERLLAALAADDKDALLAIVAEDATWVSDSGGNVRAARNVVHGAERIVRFALGLEHKWGSSMRHRVAWINAEPAIATYVDGALVYTTSLDTDGERILALYRVLNPEKLRHAGG
jgi:RNA polymerase sigma-70 factor (ECF subfamily)